MPVTVGTTNATPFRSRELILLSAAASAFLIAVSVYAQPAMLLGRESAASQGRIATDNLVQGRVQYQDGPDVRPVRFAVVNILPNDRDSYSTETDADGQFRVSLPSPGAVRVVVKKTGYVQRSWNTTASSSTQTPMVLWLDRTSSIDGKVTGIDGLPNDSIAVVVFRSGPVSATGSPIEVQRSVPDHSGRFRIHGLPAGRYLVCAKLDRLALVNIPAQQVGIVSTCFPGVTTTGDAREIPVDVGGLAPNVEFSLTRSNPQPLTGRIEMTSGEVPSEFQVTIHRVDSAIDETRCYRPSSDGRFLCPNVMPGEVDVLVTSRARSGTLEFAAQRAIVDSKLTPTPLSIVTAPAARIVGTMEWRGGAPSAVPPVVVEAISLGYAFPNLDTRPSNVPDRARAQVDARGAFVFENVAGPRMIRVTGLPDEWAVASITVRDSEFMDRPISVDPGGRPLDIRVALTKDVGAVSGSVLGWQNRSSDGRVVVFPASADSWRPFSSRIRVTHVNLDGTYVIRGLLPGDYRVAFVADPTLTLDDPSLLQQLVATSTPLQATAGTSATLDLGIRRQVP